MSFRFSIPIPCLALLVACSSPGPVLDTTNPSFEGDMPVDFSGSWERDYSRSQDVQTVVNALFRQRQRQLQQAQQNPGGPMPGMSQREFNGLISLARLVEEITRPDVLMIAQDEFEVRVAREDDFAMSCSFFEGIAQGTDSPYGTEVCSWDGDDLLSYLILADGLQISHRFTMASDGNHLRVITTAKSSATRNPFTLHRYYMKFEAPPSGFNCIETLSMKRVCSTGELEP